MEIKLETIVLSSDSLVNLSNTKLPISVSYKISKILNKIQPELTIFNDKRNELVKEYGELKNKDTEYYEVPLSSDNYKIFQEKIKELSDVMVNLDFGHGKELQKIKISDLNNITIEPKFLTALDWFLEE